MSTSATAAVFEEERIDRNEPIRYLTNTPERWWRRAMLEGRWNMGSYCCAELVPIIELQVASKQADMEMPPCPVHKEHTYISNEEIVQAHGLWSLVADGSIAIEGSRTRVGAPPRFE